MKRKIPILLMAFLILLIGKAEAATLIQKIGEGSIKTNVVAGQEVKLKFVNNGGTFSGWEVESGNVTLNTTNTEVSFIMPNENVVIKAKYLANSNLVLAKVKAGDYITYVPSSTSCTVSTSASGYTSAQTYNPSTVTSWRVFSNNGRNVEIISADSVGNLTLSGYSGYIGAVQTLQSLSAAYVNDVFALSGRSLGYSEEGLSSNQVSTYKKGPDSLGVENYGFPYDDSQYVSDANVLSSQGSMYQSSGSVWLASRRAYGGGFGAEYNDFCVRTMTANGTISFCHIQDVTLDDANEYPGIAGVRPIIKLKPELEISGGSGTVDDPWQISGLESVSISYNTNGGTGTVASQTVVKGSTVTITSTKPTRTCYEFVGWAESSSATTATYASGRTMSIGNESKTLYAVWKEKHNYTNQRTTSTYLKSAASCSNAAVYYYSCANCTAKGTSTFTSGEALTHNIVSYSTYDSSEHTTGTKCSLCGTIISSQKENHKYGSYGSGRYVCQTCGYCKCSHSEGVTYAGETAYIELCPECYSEATGSRGRCMTCGIYIQESIVCYYCGQFKFDY